MSMWAYSLAGSLIVYWSVAMPLPLPTSGPPTAAGSDLIGAEAPDDLVRAVAQRVEGTVVAAAECDHPTPLRHRRAGCADDPDLATNQDGSVRVDSDLWDIVHAL